MLLCFLLLSQVDVVVSGHNHAYSRSCPIKPDHTCTTYKNTTAYTNAGAPVFVQAGNAGAGFTKYVASL